MRTIICPEKARCHRPERFTVAHDCLHHSGYGLARECPMKWKKPSLRQSCSRSPHDHCGLHSARLFDRVGVVGRGDAVSARQVITGSAAMLDQPLHAPSCRRIENLINMRTDASAGGAALARVFDLTQKLLSAVRFILRRLRG